MDQSRLLIDSFLYRIDHHSRYNGIVNVPSNTSAIPATTIDTTSITTSTTTTTQPTATYITTITATTSTVFVTAELVACANAITTATTNTTTTITATTTTTIRTTLTNRGRCREPRSSIREFLRHPQLAGLQRAVPGWRGLAQAAHRVAGGVVCIPTIAI